MSTKADKTRAERDVDPGVNRDPDGKERSFWEGLEADAMALLKDLEDDPAAVLARLEAIEDDEFGRLDDGALDESLARLGHDPRTVARDADELRERLSSRGASVRGREGCDIPDTEDRCFQNVVTIGHPDRRASPASSADRPRKTRSVVLRFAVDRLAEKTEVWAQLQRLVAPTGLAGRLGLSFDVPSLDAPVDRALRIRTLDGQAAPDLVLICMSSDLLPVEEVLRAVPNAQVVLFLATSSDTDEPPETRRFGHLERGTTVLRYRSTREFADLSRRVLAEWLLGMRLALVFHDMRPRHRVPRECSTLCVALGGGAAFGHRGTSLSEGSRLLWNQIGGLIGAYDGSLAVHFGDFALFHFEGHERHARAVNAGDLLIRRLSRTWAPETDGGGDLPRFDLLRAVVDDLPEYSAPDTIWDIRLPGGFGFLAALTDRAGDSAVAVTGAVLERLPAGLREDFERIDDFCGATIHARTLRGEWPIPVDVSNADDVAEIVARLDATAAEGRKAHPRRILEIVKESCAALYEEILVKLRCRLDAEGSNLGRIGDGSAAIARVVLDHERRAWRRIEELVDRTCGWTESGGWLASVRQVSELRERILVDLERAVRGEAPGSRAGSPARDHRFPLRSRNVQWPPPVVRVVRNVGDLLAEDELEIVSRFACLVGKNREEILAYLRNPRYSEDLSRPSRERLWQLAELIVAEDVSERGDPERSFLEALVNGPFAEARFQALHSFMHRGRDRVSWCADDELRAWGAVVCSANRRKLWLGRLLSSSDPRRRQEALENLEPASLWLILVYSRTPVEALVQSVARVVAMSDAVFGWIAVSCVVDRWHARAAAGLGDEDAWRRGLGSLCSLLRRSPTPIELLTVERLRLAVEAWSPPNAERVTPFLNLWERRLRESSMRRDRLRLDVVAGLDSVPPGVQKYLASCGHYLEYFACHDDDRVALATFRRIDAERVARVVSQEAINDGLLERLQQDPKNFERRDALEALARSPKCDPGFTIPLLRRLPRESLLKLIRDVRARPDVRAGAEDLLQVRHLAPRGQSEAVAGIHQGL